MNEGHEEMMGLALAEAEKAALRDEVPVGAVLFAGDGQVIAAAHNRTVGGSDPTGHAEILALREAARKMGNYRLPDTVLCVTVEPCVMCMGAIIHARVARVIFGASDVKWGAAGSLYDFAADSRFNHHPEIIRGIREPECRKLMQDFFRARRKSVAKGPGML